MKSIYLFAFLLMGAKAHEHGFGKLTVGVDTDPDKKVLGGVIIEINGDIPADSILGFEHKPTTPEEKKKWESIKALLNKPLQSVVALDPLLCKVKESEVKLELEGPTHADIDLHYKIACSKAPNSLIFVLGKNFSKLKSLDVQVNAAKQSSPSLKNGQGEIKL